MIFVLHILNKEASSIVNHSCCLFDVLQVHYISWLYTLSPSLSLALTHISFVVGLYSSSPMDQNRFSIWGMLVLWFHPFSHQEALPFLFSGLLFFWLHPLLSWRDFDNDDPLAISLQIHAVFFNKMWIVLLMCLNM